MIRRNTTFPAPTASWLVRYRFGSPDDLYRHLRLAEGFFVPAHALPAEVGTRAIVEIGFPGAGDPPLLHGRVRSRSRDGAFLEAPSARSTARWVPGPDAPRRAERRLACDLFVEVGAPGAEPWICRAVDLSARGMRIAAGSAEFGLAGDEVEVTVLSPDPDLAAVKARIAWASGRSAGLELLEGTGALRPLLAAVEARWASVQEIDHDGSCVCAEVQKRAS